VDCLCGRLSRDVKLRHSIFQTLPLTLNGERGFRIRLWGAQRFTAVRSMERFISKMLQNAILGDGFTCQQEAAMIDHGILFRLKGKKP